VLDAIASGSRFGFDIMDATGLGSGSVYPTLERLEEQGMLRSRWEDARLAHREKRPPRRYFDLTLRGEEALAEGLARHRGFRTSALPGSAKRRA
jgi:PadR family transcriptional regulator PadR